jgi:ubiquinone/menaquinone biosynthesis C-methylase UbiE
MPRATAYLAHDYARFYDWAQEGREEDIPWYLDVAGRYGDPLLELACGTGRVTIPLARGGFRITGLDLSPEMLKIARAKLDREPPEVRQRVRLLQGDMACFHLDEPVKVAFVPFSSFYHLHSREQQAGCVSSMSRQLAPGGAAIIDVRPPETMADQVVGETIMMGGFVSAATGKMTRELNRKLAIDRAIQRVTVEHTYIEEEPDGREARYLFVEDYTWVTEEQMRELLREAGLKRVRVFGNYDLQPLGSRSPRMIFLAEK